MKINIYINYNVNNGNDPSLIMPLIQVQSHDDCPAVRFLGVFFDQNLNFKYHISLIKAKLSRAIYMLRTTKNLLTQKALKAVYYSLFHSHLIYCLPIWSSTCTSNLTKLISLQKTAIRLITNSRYNEHSEPLFKSCKILPFNLLVQFFNLQFMQKFKQGLLPQSFANTWTLNANRRTNHNLILRSNDDLYVPFTRLASSSKQPYVIMPKTWVDFQDETIKILRDKSQFNSALKKTF